VADLSQRCHRGLAGRQWGWDGVAEYEPDLPALDRLGDLRVPTLVLVGGFDLDGIPCHGWPCDHRIPQARRTGWPETAHLAVNGTPPDFLALLRALPARGSPPNQP
jgi:3-oxoadipate enol-lactonase